MFLGRLSAPLPPHKTCVPETTDCEHDIAQLTLAAAMLKISSLRTLSAGLLGLPLLLSACSGGAPSSEEMAQLEATLLSAPSGFNVLFGGPSRRNVVDAKSIKIVKQDCKIVKDFDSAFDCKVSFTVNDEPNQNNLRVIHHENGKWDLAKEQPFSLE